MLTGPVIMGCSKGVYLVALLHPIIICLLYDTGQEAMYVDLQVVLILGLGNVFCELIISQFGYLFFEWPMEVIIRGPKALKKQDEHPEIVQELIKSKIDDGLQLPEVKQTPDLTFGKE